MLDRTVVLILVCALIGAAGGFAIGNGFWRDAPAITKPTGVLAELPAGTTLAVLGGKRTAFGEFRGKPVLLNFWATWCGPCVREMPMLDRTAAEFAARGFAVVGIAEDDPDAVRAFVERAGVRYPILLDDSFGALSASLGNSRHVLPFSVLVDRDGKILDTHAGSFDRDTLAAFIGPVLANCRESTAC